ncbi:hypothetical protein L1887_35800 [Cichorium endivia]|nr:hypothetical protein L1887_35800 [Cichorium endivia]
MRRGLSLHLRGFTRTRVVDIACPRRAFVIVRNPLFAHNQYSHRLGFLSTPFLGSETTLRSLAYGHASPCMSMVQNTKYYKPSKITIQGITLHDGMKWVFMSAAHRAADSPEPRRAYKSCANPESSQAVPRIYPGRASAERVLH